MKSCCSWKTVSSSVSSTSASCLSKENGFWIISADGSGNISYLDMKYDFPVTLVIGSEGNGIAPLVLKNSDYIVKIPMHGKVNSLNASVASGILLAKIKEQ